MASQAQRSNPLSTNARNALQNAHYDQSLNAFYLPPSLESKVYKECNAALEVLGGKWNRGKKAHLFSDDPSARLEGLLESNTIPAANPHAYYPTPAALADRLVAMIERPVDYATRILEPSAGDGALVRALKRHYGGDCPNIDVFEIDNKHRNDLEIAMQIGGDFLASIPEGKYDLIVMNPPFAIVGDAQAYATHVAHAWGHLAPGGTLLAIVPTSLRDRETKKLEALYTLLGDMTVSQVEEGAFRASGTDVRTLIVEATKPRTAPLETQTAIAKISKAAKPAKTPATKEITVNTASATTQQPTAPLTTTPLTTAPLTTNTGQSKPNSIRLNTARFARALTILSSIAPSTSSNTALTFVRAKISGDNISLAASNLEVDLEIREPLETPLVNANDGFEVLIPCHLLTQIVRNTTEATTELRLEGQQITVINGAANYQLNTGNLSSFPKLNFARNSKTPHQLDAKRFSDAIANIGHAVSNDSNRGCFSCIQLELETTRSRLVATDGFRLALENIVPATNSDSASFPAGKYLIKARHAFEIKRIFRDGDISLVVSGKRLTIYSPTSRIAVPLGDGSLPDYERIIPKVSEVNCLVNAASLKEAIGRVALVADIGRNSITIEISNHQIALSSKSDRGEGREIVQTISSDHNTNSAVHKVNYRVKQLAQALEAQEGTVSLGISGNAPAVFTSEGRDALELLNPLRE